MVPATVQGVARMFIDQSTTREQLIQVWHDNANDLVDVFINAGVDPDLDETPTEEIRNVIISWIEAGDECAGC